MRILPLGAFAVITNDRTRPGIPFPSALGGDFTGLAIISLRLTSTIYAAAGIVEVEAARAAFEIPLLAGPRFSGTWLEQKKRCEAAEDGGRRDDLDHDDNPWIPYRAVMLLRRTRRLRRRV